MKPASEDLMTMFGDYDAHLKGIDPEREALYRLCETRDVGMTVMKGFFGGALLDEKRSPFGVAFTPAQLISILDKPTISGYT